MLQGGCGEAAAQGLGCRVAGHMAAHLSPSGMRGRRCSHDALAGSRRGVVLRWLNAVWLRFTTVSLSLEERSTGPNWQWRRWHGVIVSGWHSWQARSPV